MCDALACRDMTICGRYILKYFYIILDFQVLKSLFLNYIVKHNMILL